MKRPARRVSMIRFRAGATFLSFLIVVERSSINRLKDALLTHIKPGAKGFEVNPSSRVEGTEVRIMMEDDAYLTKDGMKWFRLAADEFLRDSLRCNVVRLHPAL
jgi:hypothetical protein